MWIEKADPFDMDGNAGKIKVFTILRKNYQYA